MLACFAVPSMSRMSRMSLTNSMSLTNNVRMFRMSL